MRWPLIIVILLLAVAAWAQVAIDGSSPSASRSLSPAAVTTTPTPTGGAAAAPNPEADLMAEVERLTAELDEANGIIDELRMEAADMRGRAKDAEAKAAEVQDSLQSAETRASDAEAKLGDFQQAAQDAETRASEAEGELAEAIDTADKLQARADAAEAKIQELLAESADLRAKAAALDKRIVELEAARDAKAAVFSTFGELKIDASLYPQRLITGFDTAIRRMGTWSVSGGIAAQTDPRQYFSRLTFPLVQTSTPTLFSFEFKTGARGWVGAGIHIFAEGVLKPRGYGEGRSLLVWLTRDQKARGGPWTWLQLYRSDDDVNMERVLDAKIAEGMTDWHRVDVLYEPGREFAVVAIDGTIRAAYRTYFGLGSGLSVSLRTLGEGVSFRNFAVRR